MEEDIEINRFKSATGDRHGSERYVGAERSWVRSRFYFSDVCEGSLPMKQNVKQLCSLEVLLALCIVDSQKLPMHSRSYLGSLAK